MEPVKEHKDGIESGIFQISATMNLNPVINTDVPAAPDVYCTAGDYPGEIDLQWDPVAGATTYLVEISFERPLAWKPLATSKQSKFTVRKLIPGSLYWFRVFAININGKSTWSTPALKVAPK